MGVPLCPSVPTPGLVATVHEVGDVGEGGDGETRQVLHVGSEQGVLPHPQPPPALGVQQVPHPLAVDLQVAHLGAPKQSGGPPKLVEVEGVNPQNGGEERSKLGASESPTSGAHPQIDGDVGGGSPKW